MSSRKPDSLIGRSRQGSGSIMALAAFALSAIGSYSTWAQAPVLEEVVVTATKRESNLQDVAVAARVLETAERGVLAGNPVVDFRVRLLDGQYHDVDSSEMAFKIAGQAGIKEAAARAGAVLMEPIMNVEVVTPEEYLGDVVGDLNRRRGQIEGMEATGNTQTVRAKVPLSEMFGYSTDLRSATQGRANYTMLFGQYEQVPNTVQEEIVKRVRGE